MSAVAAGLLAATVPDEVLRRAWVETGGGRS